MPWTVDDIPDQTENIVVITGANTGIGFEAARVLAGRGARVIVACRNVDKGQHAVERIVQECPAARVELTILDVSDLSSVHRCTEHLRGALPRIDRLINNAGVMAIPRAVTADGFELQLATNHLGHFALTGRLFPLLQRSPEPRVVTVASTLHRRGRIAFDDLHGERRYDRWDAYAQSKLANLLFCQELQRRTAAMAPRVMSVACHPGYASTQLQAVAANAGVAPMRWGMNLARRLAAQDARGGALPILFAATGPAKPGGYYGPSGLFGLRGAPGPARPSARALDEDVAARLWDVSIQLTGVAFP